ncbi:uncharacterized protein TRIADDRAFT_53251 [Trichoplax adhaerens]|uniref:SET domain-containing protein n=1 Tax=Trichoplax adhaerens TaxID=10228 RepID=B3RNQ6_TRIAD|nr:hypothetical protein TRIADDRAFT_53251 [Trichoplax adhaerens]EDV28054.1 hypothetical protein TRIADDRAFT_53251 [Trichoplax adhaerens]|eukprot:XP_002109888.1 hypothetical protein TRIADDRAFT_53251 [Trichoplax adhaerens]
MAYFQSWSDNVEIFETYEKGRGIRCKKQLAIGTSVGKENPFCHVVSQDMLSSYCHSCLLMQSELYKCSRCKIIMYCCKSCQKEDWQWHKYECKSITRLGPKVPPDSIRLLGRVAYTILQGQDRADQFKFLLSNRELLEGSRKNTIVDGINLLKEYLSNKVAINENEIIEIISRVTCNTFTICNSEMQTVGIGVYPGLSLVNHSCSPNCSATFRGKQMQLRIIENTKIGDELLISYIDPMQVLSSRQNQLQSQYCFKCICERCIDTTKDSCNNLMDSVRCPKKICKAASSLDSLLANKLCPECGSIVDQSFFAEIENFQAQINKTISLGYQQAKLEDLKKLFIEGKQRLGECNMLYIRIIENLMDAYIESQRYEEALEYARRLEEPYCRLYPRYYPVTGVHLMKQGKLECYLGKFGEAVKSLGKAKEILLVSHGKECGLIHEMNEMVSI